MAERFTSERRERVLTLLEVGRNVEEAAAAVGVNPSTVHRWAARGRAKPAGDAGEFARRFDAFRAGEADANLSREDLLRLLERSARRGSVQAIRLLLAEFPSGSDGERASDAPTDMAGL